MNAVRNLCEVDDLSVVADDFSTLLDRPDNSDIYWEFLGWVDRYKGETDVVTENLRKDQETNAPAIRQQLIAYAGERAVGMSQVGYPCPAPPGVKPEWPNVSSWISNPYRNQGLGKLSMVEGLKVVDEQFGGNAWTCVRKSNVYSHKMVSRVGFTVVGEMYGSNIYTYHAA